MAKEKGSAHAILVGVLVVLLLGALGFIFWQNFVQKDDKKQAETTTTEPTKTETKSPEDDKKYVVIDSFGVKFDAPTDGTKIEWANDKDGNDAVGFLTNNLSNDDVSCNAKSGAAGYLERSKTELKNIGVGGGGTLLNDGEKIDGYYYRFDLPNGRSCDDDNPSDYEEAQKIEKLAETIQSAE